jgi:hypothetical protein
MIYIQSDSERLRPHHFDCACGMFGAIEIDSKYRLTSFEEVISGKFDTLIRSNLFIGSVEFMREVFKRIGINNVRLPKNSNREHEIITLGEALIRTKSGEELFIKPIEIKLFTGFVLDKSAYTSINSIPNDTKVMAYKPFKHPLETEWRFYIHNHKIVDARNYSGDFLKIPSYEYVLKCVSENKETFPIAYTIDIGITNKETVVIEYNDMWSIGNYGVDNITYLKLLKDRYFEIIKNNQNA